MALYAIKDIKPNPFRHIDRYPIKRDKVSRLRESFQKTGFWDNVVARANNGKAEIAYGHHRLVALKEEFGANHKINIIIRDLDDEHMIQIMARENMEEWGTSAAIEHETIRAVVEAYGQGLISIPLAPKTPPSQARYAPSFIQGNDAHGAYREHPYTAQSIANFIGWLQPNGMPQEKVLSALTALQFIEEGVLKESDFDGLTTKQAEAVVEEARRAKTQREAAARVHRMQAEQAEREAQEAERRREEAERERRRREIEAAAARDAAAKRRALDEAKRHEQERRVAEQDRQRAVKREQVERGKEQKFVEEGRRRATVVGRAVSSSLKGGDISIRQATEAVRKLEGKQADTVPPRIEEFAKRLATDISGMLDPERDQRVGRLNELVKYQEYLDDYTRADLARTLEKLANRALDYAKQFSGGSTSGRRSLPAANRR